MLLRGAFLAAKPRPHKALCSPRGRARTSLPCLPSYLPPFFPPSPPLPSLLVGPAGHGRAVRPAEGGRVGGAGGAAQGGAEGLGTRGDGEGRNGGAVQGRVGGVEVNRGAGCNGSCSAWATVRRRRPLLPAQQHVRSQPLSATLRVLCPTPPGGPAGGLAIYLSLFPLLLSFLLACSFHATRWPGWRLSGGRCSWGPPVSHKGWEPGVRRTAAAVLNATATAAPGHAPGYHLPCRPVPAVNRRSAHVPPTLLPSCPSRLSRAAPGPVHQGAVAARAAADGRRQRHGAGEAAPRIQG
jgi:hypothetical protein